MRADRKNLLLLGVIGWLPSIPSSSESSLSNMPPRCVSRRLSLRFQLLT